MKESKVKSVQAYSRNPSSVYGDCPNNDSIASTGRTYSSKPKTVLYPFPNGVKSLRDQKYKVKIQHFRFGYKTNDRDEKPSYHRRHEIKFILLRGGKTIMEIESSAGRYYVSDTFCSKKDVFCYKTGVQECLKKILPMMKEYGEKFCIEVDLESLIWLK